MSLRSGNIPSLIQGVSQQPASLRLPTQLELQENCFSSTVEGLIRRPPTEHIAMVSAEPLDDAFMYDINRDVTERYNVIVTSYGTIKVFDLEGDEKDVEVDTDTSLTLLTGAVANTTGATFYLALAQNETAVDFVVTGVTDASVLLQASIDNVSWDTLNTRTTNGTSAGVNIVGSPYKYVRVKVEDYVAGTIAGSITYKNTRYLVCTDPKTDIGAVTIADFTFVNNKTKTPALTSAVTTIRDPEGLVFVKQGNYGSVYSVYVDGALRATYTTSNTDVATLKTDAIASDLYDDLVAWAGASYSFSVSGSTIHIVHDPDVDQNLPLVTSKAAVFNGDPFSVSATSGETDIDFVASGITTATVKLQSSADGVSWTDRATRTSTGTTTIAISTLAGDTYIRGIISAWTAGTITLKANYKRADFDLQVVDSQGGNSLKAFKDTTARFSELPVTAPNGFVIGIDANPDTKAGKYYIKAVTTQGGSFGECTWQECPKMGIQYVIDPATMPHSLIRQEDGNFTFETIEWTNRLVGDDDTNSEPSFIGTPILDIFFYKNRLAFLADEYAVLSQTAEYFNFWRTTVTQIVDTDVVDFRAVHTKVSILKHGIAFNKSMMLFSDQTQFEIPGDVAMTPDTVRCDPASEFEGNMVTKPINAGKSIYFVFNREGYAGLKELFLAENTNSNNFDAADLTAHAPSYIPAGVFCMTGSTLDNVTCLITEGDQSAIYVYKAAYNPSDNRKVQSAWFRWSFGDEETTKVLNAKFIETTLYLLIQRGDEVWQEKMVLQPSRVDPGSTYVTHLDRRYDDTGLTPAYDVDTNSTTFPSLPWAPTADTVVASKDGDEPNILDYDADSITVQGDYSVEPVWIGERYLSRAQPSTIYIREQGQGGSVTIDEASRLQLLRGYLNYANSGYFKVSVTPRGRTTSVYIFTGRLVGDSENILGAVALQSGKFSFAILSKNDRVTIELSSNSFLPFRFTSMEWEGTYTKRSSEG